MDISLGPVDPAACPHPADQLLIAHSGADTAGSWTATCKRCITTFRRGQPDVPQHVLDAVAIHVGAAVRISRAEAGARVTEVGRPWVFDVDGSEYLEWIFGPGLPFVTGALVTDVTPTVLSVFHSARTEFALTVGDHALMLGVRWYDTVLDWWHAPWQASRAVAAGMEPMPGEADAPAGQHVGVHLALVDCATGIVAGLRLVTWPAQFFNRVRAAVQHQVDHGLDDAAGSREVELWNNRFRDARTLALTRADITCRGGGN